MAGLMISSVGWGQPWTYDFGTSTGSFNNASGNTETFFTATPTNGGTYRIRCASSGNQGSGFVLANPGTSLGSYTELQINASKSASTNKFGVYNWTSPTQVAYLKFKYRTTSSDNGKLNVSLGVNTLVSDNNGYTNQYNNSLVSLTITYVSGSIQDVVRRVNGSNSTITSHGFIKDTDQEVEIYANNSTGNSNYERNGTIYTLATKTWDLWVDGTITVTGAATAGNLAAGTNLSGFSFFAESSTNNAAYIYIDDIEYSNSLPTGSSPDITVDPSSLTGFTYVAGGGPSLEKSFTVSGINLTADISITASANYEISTTSGSGYTSPITLIQNGGTVNDTTIYVRLKAGLNAGNYFNEDITASSTGAIDKTVTCSGTVIPPPDPEPSNHVTDFTATTGDPTYSVINVAWVDDSTGTQLPSGYLIKGSSVGYGDIVAPVDGITEADAPLVKNIPYGVQVASFTGLNENTTYYFKIYPYTNSGDDIDYKTDGVVPQADATTTYGIPAAPVATAATTVGSTGFTANWNAVAGATGYQLDVYTKTAGINASDLFISEYIEGSSNNKAIEIFNGTGSDVDLSVYSIKKQSNGVGDFGGNLVLTGTLANNSVYVIAHSSASQTILNKANQTIGSSPLDFNGNDAVALYKNNIQIDVVGIVDQTANWGKDITLVRKSNILNPTISYSINDWDSYATDTFDYLGSHTFDGGTTNNYLNGFENKDVGNVIYYNLTGLNSSTKYFYVVRASNDAGTSENSNEIWVTIGAAASTYTGTGNWANGSNWSNGMPGENTNVTIEGFVTVDDIYTCNNFTIAPTGRVTIPETVNQQKGLWIKGDFLIRSDATGAGSFIGIYDQDLNWNYEVQGTTTVERYISGASYAWHLISSPVSNQAIAGDWIPTSTGYDFYAWNEPTQTWLNQKVSANNITHFIPCKGYLVAYEETGATKTFTGTLNDGAQTLGLTVTGATSYYGSNLAGNPYPSSIDWKGNNNAIDKSKLVGYNASEGVKHYIWNDASGNYGVYSDANAGDAGTNGANRYIAPMQGFFVSAASNGSFLINDSARVHSSQAWLKSGNNYEFRLCVNAPQGYGSDELLLEFGHNVSVGSAEKWFSFVPTAPSIYSPIEDKKFSIRYLSIQDETLTIPVSFIAGVDGTYTLTANFASSTYSAIKLEDKITGKVHDLLLTPEYSFSANKSDISERFLLHFTVTYGIENLEENADIQIYSYGNSIYLNNNTDSETLVSVYNITGRQIYQDRVGAGSQHTFTINAPTGLYIVKALTGKSITSRKVFIW